ncbi:MAG: hypothetical protein LBB74_08395 [Chitinispirillales bacterium]|jgi:hypothetical protein|nr:hypothetical protein [Chitinispirillales bacterium]
MSTYDEHMERVGHNKALLDFLEIHEGHSVFSDWFVTVAFYTAVQRVEAMLFLVKPQIRGRVGTTTAVEHCNGHRERSAVIGRCFENLYFSYTALYGYSRIAKYRCYIPGPPNGKNAKELLQDIEAKCRDVDGRG